MAAFDSARMCTKNMFCPPQLQVSKGIFGGNMAESFSPRHEHQQILILYTQNLTQGKVGSDGLMIHMRNNDFIIWCFFRSIPLL
jgi:hypothetical protein